MAIFCDPDAVSLDFSHQVRVRMVHERVIYDHDGLLRVGTQVARSALASKVVDILIFTEPEEIKTQQKRSIETGEHHCKALRTE